MKLGVYSRIILSPKTPMQHSRQVDLLLVTFFGRASWPLKCIETFLMTLEKTNAIMPPKLHNS